jgi:hypothetical protein
MKRRPFTVALTVLLLVSCSEDESNPLKVGSTGSDATVTVTLNVYPNELSPGEGFGVYADIVNHGPDIELELPCEHYFGYRLRSADGEVLWSYPEDCPDEPQTLLLEKEGRYTAAVESNAWLVLGQYQIEAGIYGYETDYPWVTASLSVVEPAAPAVLAGTLTIDTTLSVPDTLDSPVFALDGETTEFFATYHTASPVSTSDYVHPDYRIRSAHTTTGPLRWYFSNPRFASVVNPLFATRSLIVEAARFEEIGNESRRLSVRVTAYEGVNSYQLTISGDFDFPVDEDGFPVLKNDLELLGRASLVQQTHPNLGVGLASATGDAEIRIENLTAR